MWYCISIRKSTGGYSQTRSRRLGHNVGQKNCLRNNRGTNQKETFLYSYCWVFTNTVPLFLFLIISGIFKTSGSRRYYPLPGRSSTFALVPASKWSKRVPCTAHYFSSTWWQLWSPSLHAAGLPPEGIGLVHEARFCLAANRALYTEYKNN